MKDRRSTLIGHSIALSFRNPSMYYLRVVAISGLVICAHVGRLSAEENDKKRFLETTTKLVKAINTQDIPTIETMLSAEMQQFLPADKATPFFGGMVTARGKLKDAGIPAVKGSTATVRVSAERGAWTFKITLDASDKIAGLLVTPAAKAAARVTDDRFTKIAKKLIREINSEHFQAIENMLNAQMQEAVPLDKAAPFFRKLVATSGKLKEPGTPTIKGSTATLRVQAERGALKFKITLDAADKISELRITEAKDAAAPATADRFTKVAKKLIDAINGDDMPAFETMLDAEMQQEMPREKAAPFFRSIITDTGKLKEAGAPRVTGNTAIVKVTAERGALDLKITLDDSDKITGLYITPSTSASTNDSTAVARSHTSMQLPFRGEWYIVWGGDNETVNHHVAAPGQRRAADIIIKGPDDGSHKASGQRNEDYYVYGQEILAAASGEVVTAIDGVPDNAPGSMNPYCAVGNCLIIDQGQNEYAVYAHLQPGSLRVHRGDKVQQGQVLGLCGNSGNSSEPHLHFHLQDSAVLQDGAGITPYFTGVKCRRGELTLTNAEYTFLKGDRIESSSSK
jgi:murein DD-endopeptidase MepM/ murein hydrolase activator NlpD